MLKIQVIIKIFTKKIIGLTSLLNLLSVIFFVIQLTLIRGRVFFIIISFSRLRLSRLLISNRILFAVSFSRKQVKQEGIRKCLLKQYVY